MPCISVTPPAPCCTPRTPLRALRTAARPASALHCLPCAQGVLFVIEAQTGRDISGCSAYPDEAELLLPRNSQFVVTGISEHNPMQLNDLKAEYSDDEGIVCKCCIPVLTQSPPGGSWSLCVRLVHGSLRVVP